MLRPFDAALMADYFTVGMMMNAVDQRLPPDRKPLMPALPPLITSQSTTNHQSRITKSPMLLVGQCVQDDIDPDRVGIG